VFGATFDDPYLNGELISPADGDVIVVKFHPKTHAVKMDRRDPALSSRKRERRERDEVQQHFDAAANAAPGVAAPSAANDAGSRLSSQVEAPMDELERRDRSGELTEAQLKRGRRSSSTSCERHNAREAFVNIGVLGTIQWASKAAV
jgi:hypothetical protein